MELSPNTLPIFLAVASLIFTIVGFLLKRVLAKIDGLSSNTGDIKTSLAVSGNQVETVLGAVSLLRKQNEKTKDDLQTALIATASIADMKKEIAVLERNQATIFKKLDALADSFGKLSNIISVLRSQIISKEGK